MHIDVYGSSLCALVTAGSLASTGHSVVLRLPEGDIARQLQRGECPFSEPGLEVLLNEQRHNRRLRLGRMVDAPEDGVSTVFLALDLDDIELAHDIVARLASLNRRFWLVVNQSAFPVGTTDKLQQTLGDGGAVVSLPELLQEGVAVQQFMRPPQLLLGCDDPYAEALVREILRPVSRLRDQFLVMSPKQAEFAKFAIMGMLATRVSFMNDMASLADALDVDIEPVRQAVGADPRIGPAYLYPGCGFGGPSLSRNVMDLANVLEASGIGSQLLDHVLRINERQKEVLFRKLWRHYHTRLEGRVVAIWGASFKPNTGRIDNAPVLRMLEALWAQGALVRVHDPMALPTLRSRFGAREDLRLCTDPYEAATGADALMLVTEWKEYWNPDFGRLRLDMRVPVLLDGRNIYDPDFVRRSGFTYYGVGR